MSADNANKIDIAPLTVIVSEALDPRVRRKLEAEQQADVKTYEEMTRSLQVQEDLNKIREEVNNSDDDEADPFKQPEAVENNAEQAAPAAPAPADNPAEAQPAAAPAAEPAAAAPAAPAEAQPAEAAAPAAAPAEGEGAADEDLSSAFESHGTNLPKDLFKRVAKEYLALESSDSDTVGELEHIKMFVFVDLADTAVSGDTLESVQTLRDPENTIVVINEKDAKDADTTLRARRVAQQLADRGVRIFYSIDEATDYLNELYDIVSGRKKG